METTLDAPLSAASALHDIFERLNGADAKNIFLRWQTVSKVRPDNADFPKVHLEQVALLAQIQRDIDELPEKDRLRCSRYVPQWWAALVRFRTDWVNEGGAFIEQPALDALAFLGSLVESRRSSPRPSDEQWTALRGTITQLLKEVEDDVDLPSSTREQIKADLRHVLWLMDNVSVYGVDRVVSATQETAGRLASTATRTGVQKVAHWFGVCTVCINAFTGLAVNVATAVTTSVAAYQEVFGIERGEREGGENEDQILKIIVEQPARIAAQPGPTPEAANATPTRDVSQ